eukprot:SAG31_NODE_695_length_12765_cov_6.974499_9_plen_92_part_00
MALALLEADGNVQLAVQAAREGPALLLDALGNEVDPRSEGVAGAKDQFYVKFQAAIYESCEYLGASSRPAWRVSFRPSATVIVVLSFARGR